MKKLLFIIVLIFLLAIPSAVLAWTWTSTYDCPEWELNGANDPQCDGLYRDQDLFKEGHGEQITSAANMAAGDGGRGQRHWECDGDNQQTGGLNYYLPSSSSEIWVRWYMRYQAGFNWGSLLGEKILYWNQNGPWLVFPHFSGDQGGSIRIYYDGSTGGHVGTSWYDVFGSTSDGLWHRFDLYMKVGGSDIFRIWIDGSLVMNETSINIGLNTFTWLIIGSNQKTPSNGQCEAVDFDDWEITNVDPGTLCAGGYTCIGALAAGGDTDPPTLSLGGPSGVQPCD